MTKNELDSAATADVKCYHCGHVSGQHVSGQIVGPKQAQFKVSDFVPRPGYTGPEAKSGSRLRCERCRGPVFLEESRPTSLAESRLRRGSKPGQGREIRPSKAA